MKNLHYVDGEIAEPTSVGPQIVGNICTDTGIWTGDSAKAIARKWPQARQAYTDWHRQRIRNEFILGGVQFVNGSRANVNRIIRIANMIAQPDANRPVSYRALRKCLIAVGRKAIKIGATVHLPKLDDTQTDSWQDIELIIYNTLCTALVQTYIYSPPQPTDGQWFGDVIRRERRTIS